MSGDCLKQLGLEVVRYLERFTLAGAVEVRERAKAALEATPRLIAPQANSVCTRWLDEALTVVRSQGETSFATAIARAASQLQWLTYDSYALDEIGAFADHHCYASLIGEAAPFFARDYDLGLFLIAPGILYRDHQHAAPELYAPLTGPHGWRFEVDQPFRDKPAHEPVWNEPWQVHATQTGNAPFLCVFCWTRDVNAPARVV